VAFFVLVASTVARAGDRIYWSNFTANKIFFSELDGSASGEVATGTSTKGPVGVAIDAAAGRIYWANYSYSTLSFAHLDGSGSADLPTPGVTPNSPNGVGIDPAAGRLYWANHDSGVISFANLDGSGGSNLPTGAATVSNAGGAAIDPGTGRIYWANHGLAAISFANLDGSGGGDVTTGGATLSQPSGVAVDPTTDRIYWPNVDDSIGFARLDGSGGGNLPTGEATVHGPRGVAIDPGAGRIYWVNQVGAKVSYANLDGSGGGDLPLGMAQGGEVSFPVLLKAPAAIGTPLVTGGSSPHSTLSCTAEWAPDLLGSFLYRAPSNTSLQWSRDGTDIPGATGASFTATAAGDYSCRATASNFAGSTTQVSTPHRISLPSNSFKVGKLKLNRRKGTAKLAIFVPGPGKMTLAGAGLVRQGANSRRGGKLSLTIKPRGKKKHKLEQKGKVKVRAKLTFVPTGGTARTVKKKMVLKMRRRA
jgi:hypothetical protein